MLSDRQRRKEYDEARSLFGAGGAAVPAARRHGTGGRTGVRLRRPVRRRAAAAASATSSAASSAPRAGTVARRPGAAPTSSREVTLAFTDAVDGVTVPLRMASEQACPTCRGTGGRGGTMPRSARSARAPARPAATRAGSPSPSRAASAAAAGMVVDDPCPDCSGSGRAMGSRTMTVRIPAGVKDGQRIRLKGKGARASAAGRPATSSSSCTSRRTRCSAAAATT